MNDPINNSASTDSSGGSSSIRTTNSHHEKTPPLLFSIRFLLSITLFFGVGVQYMQKIDMGLGIVCMVNNTALKLDHHHQHHQIDFSDSYYKNNQSSNCMFTPLHGNKTDGPFAWSKQVQGFVLSSYFYGYILTQVLSGWLSLRYGGRKVAAFSMLFGSLMTMLVSESARLGYGVLILTRFVTGLAHGCVWPAVSHLYANWAPPSEKSRMIGFSSSGVNVGNIAALMLGSYLCVHGFDGGWSSIFYTFGLIGCVWCVLFLMLTAETPSQHKFISGKEREYIIAKTRGTAASPVGPYAQQSGSGLISFKNTPWRAIFTSKPCIAVFLSHACSNWSNYLFLTQLPTYMNDILQFDIKSNGLLSSLPYVASLVIATSAGFVGDRLIKAKTFSKTNVRKLFNGMGFLIPFFAVIGLAYVTCANPYLAVALLTLGLGCIGFATGAGFLVNLNEVAGKYSGILFGISNTFATIPGIVAPYIVGILTSHKEQKEWQIVFWMTAAINLVGFVTYTMFASTQVERWAVADSSSDDRAIVRNDEDGEDENESSKYDE